MSAGPTIDFATILGTLGGFALIVAAMVLGGSPGAFVDVPAMLIVLGGSFLITTVSFSFKEILKAQKVMLKAVAYQQREPQDAALQVLHLAELARKNGALGMEAHMKDFRNEPFLKKAMDLVIDGTTGEEVERVMLREAESTVYRHNRSAGVLRRAGEVAPAMGLIGTLVGLVQMLGNLEDPSSIGPAMAVALLTTFYGAVLANMVFLPLANKLERNSGLEAMVNQIYAMGAASIGRQENPRRLETMLNSILPPAQRVNYFD
ncbi:flagellar motor protein MotA [Rhodovibrio salinarum]|uniref:Flagellar motor protein MotA n=2 Tax=Rhodovibrio salinarum TaxID=1087 RepID=A0A934QIK7_9PROT|nr:flagellar motor protein MotA [Rhodovibrio salinarum]